MRGWDEDEDEGADVLQEVFRYDNLLTIPWSGSFANRFTHYPSIYALWKGVHCKT